MDKTAITEKNLLKLLWDYFESIGLGRAARGKLTAEAFTDALVLELSAVCLVPGNKPKDSRSHQTHIHVTGNNRYFFFNRSAVDYAAESTGDCRQEVTVSRANINALADPSWRFGGPDQDLGLEKSYTMKKIACRQAQESQVQVSKLRRDGEGFIDLRDGLHEKDLLVFLKNRNSGTMLAVGVPRGFYEEGYWFADGFLTGLESEDAVTVKNALLAVMEEYGEGTVMKGTDRISDAVYQELVDAADPSSTDYAAEKYIPADPDGREVKSGRPATAPALGKEAIMAAGYQCAVDGSHHTFHKRDGTPYMEVHHLIPLERQGGFENKLDTKANLVSVCPLCHKLIHYGRMEEAGPVIMKLYGERKDALRDSGLDITLEQLLQFYS